MPDQQNGAKARAATETLRAAAFDAYPQPMAVLGRDAGVEISNPAWRAVMGDVERAPALLAVVGAALGSGGSVRAREVTVGVHGVSAEAVATAIGEDAAVVGLHLATDDGDDSHELESLGGIARLLAHEVKNPLAGIRGAAQLLKPGASNSDKGLADLIVAETDRIHRLVDRIEELGFTTKLQTKAVDLHAVLGRVRGIIAADAVGVRITEAFDPSLPAVAGDEDRLIQLFLNLAKNAAEAAASTPGAGEVEIATAYRHGAFARTADGARLHRVPLEVSVRDNGPGVPAKIRERIFEAFVSGRPGGTGLGLALCARIAAAHGGDIALESEPGRTVFRVRLPVFKEAAA